MCQCCSPGVAKCVRYFFFTLAVLCAVAAIILTYYSTNTFNVNPTSATSDGVFGTLQEFVNCAERYPASQFNTTDGRNVALAQCSAGQVPIIFMFAFTATIFVFTFLFLIMNQFWEKPWIAVWIPVLWSVSFTLAVLCFVLQGSNTNRAATSFAVCDHITDHDKTLFPFGVVCIQTSNATWKKWAGALASLYAGCALALVALITFYHVKYSCVTKTEATVNDRIAANTNNASANPGSFATSA
jgi:hypothetical protein